MIFYYVKHKINVISDGLDSFMKTKKKYYVRQNTVASAYTINYLTNKSIEKSFSHACMRYDDSRKSHLFPLVNSRRLSHFVTCHKHSLIIHSLSLESIERVPFLI